jgi:integrase
MELIKNRSERVRAERILKYFETVSEYDLKISELGSNHLQSFINARTADGVKVETINREMNILSTALKTAGEIFPDRLIGYDAPRIPRPRFKKKGRTRVVTETEKDLIYNFLTVPRIQTETAKVFENRIRIARMFEISWLLGLRFGEVARLEK